MLHNAIATAQSLSPFAVTYYVVIFTLALLTAIALWPVFAKAGVAGWAAFVPILDTYVLVKIAGFRGWVLLLYLVPGVGIVTSIVVALRVGKAFGKGYVFGFLLLWLLAPIGYFIMGYGPTKYIGGAHAEVTGPPNSTYLARSAT